MNPTDKHTASSKDVPEYSDDDLDEMDEDDLIVLEDDDAEKFLDYVQQRAAAQQELNDEEDVAMRSVEDEAVYCAECEPSDMVLSAHEASVFCMSVDPLNEMLVSGGEDDRAIVWTLNDGRPLCSLQHEESVTHVAFSRNGQLLATGDLAGHIQVWSRSQLFSSPLNSKPDNASTIPLLETKEALWSEAVQEELQWMHWYPHGSDNTTILLAGGGDKDGTIGVWLIVASDVTRCNAKYLPGVDGTACVAAHHMSSSNPQALLAVYTSGRLRRWNIKDGSTEEDISLLQWLEMSSKDQVDKEEKMDDDEEEGDDVVVSMAVKPGMEHLVAVGFESGYLLLVSILGKQCMLSLRTKDHGSVEGVAFSAKHPYLAYGSVKGELGVVDTQNGRLRTNWVQMHENSRIGITCLRWLDHADQPLFLTGNVDGSVCVWQALKSPAESLLRRVQVHSNTVLNVVIGAGKHKETDSNRTTDMICSCGDDFTVRVNYLPSI